jgi:hypothetical protein
MSPPKKMEVVCRYQAKLIYQSILLHHYYQSFGINHTTENDQVPAHISHYGAPKKDRVKLVRFTRTKTARVKPESHFY